MITFATQRLLFVTALLLTYGAIAQAGGKAMESDWLELVKGSRGDTMGAQLMEIETNDADSTRTVTLAIPKQSMGDPDEIEEVLVIGKMPEKSEPLDVSYEWVRDYDDDNYGLIIHMGSENNWPIRIFMNAVQEVEQ
jgi:hypothetical protein